jgi:hypothetical protein
MAAAAQMGCGLRLAGLLFLAASTLLPSALRATTFYVTVAGLGGEPDYETRFALLASETEKLLTEKGGDIKVETFKGAVATKANLIASLTRIAQAAKPADAFVLMMIGHGSFDGEYKFNLPGPDISATELAGLLNKIAAGRQLVVNMTSASGGSLDALKGNNRVIITATKTGTEKNATVFARFWVEALRDPSADIDKNGSISALEAFQFADRKTKAFYEEQKRIATEHPVLEDNNKAGAFPVLRLTAANTVTDPAKQALQAKRDEIESQIDQLKYQKALMPADQYKAQLSKLLLELAKTQEEIDK